MYVAHKLDIIVGSWEWLDPQIMAHHILNSTVESAQETDQILDKEEITDDLFLQQKMEMRLEWKCLFQRHMGRDLLFSLIGLKFVKIIELEIEGDIYIWGTQVAFMEMDEQVEEGSSVTFEGSRSSWFLPQKVTLASSQPNLPLSAWQLHLIYIIHQ